MRMPIYFGGMILSDINTAYDYENWLVSMLKYRYEKYSENWGLHAGMEALLKGRLRQGLYIKSDFHYIPTDPLVYISEDITYWHYLSLKRKKLNILKLEVFKFYRRHGRYPL